MKIMMIDPWGINNISIYTNGLCKGISKYEDLTLVTNYYYEKTTDARYFLKRDFFKISEKMGENKFRKIFRGIEYINSYRKIVKDLKKNQYDIVHIQWLLQYKADIYFLKEIKKHCKKVVYTAHNVVPHINGGKYIKDLRSIYKLVDSIILHGDALREEFRSLFSEYSDKVIIQKHGTYLNQSTSHDVNAVEDVIIDKVEQYSRVFIFFGKLFYNKGVDRIVKVWLENYKSEDQLLIIAGRRVGEYKEFAALQSEINGCENILYINRYVEDNLLNYLISKSDVIVLPYRHASMSGVIFTAAEFKKTVLCTDTGAISEYIINEENSFLVENDDDKLYEKLRFISTKVSKRKLVDMGIKLNENIIANYSWSNIGKKLIEEAYKL